MAKNLILWLVIAVVLMSVFQSFSPGETSRAQTDYTTFINEVNNGNIREVRINSDAREIRGLRSSGESFVTYIPVLRRTINLRLDQTRRESVRRAP